ncbi:MAG: DUF1735 domain-containing protein [Arcicella sp.]|nr:DUF1735 domain-containing protein [Arcicella sp.]
MKKYFKIAKVLSLAFVALTFACVPEGKDIIEGQGSNFVKIPTGGSDINVVGVDLVPGEKTVDLFEVIRESNSASELASSSLNVSLKMDDALITAYNAANQTTFIPLPTNLYKLSEMEVAMKPGDFARTIKMTFDPTKLDPTKSYAIAVNIANAGSYKLRNGLSSAVFQVIAKNRFDAVYTTTGTMTDFANAGLTGNYPTEMELVTDGALKVIVRDRALGSTNPFHSILSGGSVSYYGAFGLAITFKEDNTVASIVNVYGQPSANGRSAELDPSGVNKWDPVTKTLKIKYWMNQPTVITPHRTSFDETFTFKSKR